ncbi:MAG TPA: hypothetical protein VFT42_07215, partial [Solirubrobacteraceae bacterium]|nr:hypothetical protein [Solirubrobacteraceae bacterium]
MNRNKVIVDGTLPGKGKPCSSAPSRQDLGAKDKDGNALGRNGILVYKTDGVSVENLTACNFLSGDGSAGNEIWFNGGDGSGKIGLGKFTGRYLNATTTYFKDNHTAAGYGIFSSNADGPGLWDYTYASNFNDSDYYIGACQQVCNQVLDHGWAQYSALGYSGTNSGGNLVIENSQFDHNKDGFDTNSQNNDDSPSPQDGACPKNGTSPITKTHSCWVFEHNNVHDNNNPNVPAAGFAAAGPVGTGMSVSGGRNDTVMDNRFANNGAWGTIFVPFPDSGPPCSGGTSTPAACIFDESGDALIDNTYEHNGFFGNPSNGDFAETRFEPGPSDCFSGNTEAGGGAPTTSPPLLQTLEPTCGGNVPPDLNPVFTDEVACDAQAISIGPIPAGDFCLPGANYPRRTKVVLAPLPSGLKSMRNPCLDVPADPWCPGTTTTAAARAKAKRRR